MASNNSQNYTFKVIENEREISKCQTHSKRRFLRRIRTINWQNRHPTVYLRVSYGKHKNVFGKTVTFYNDGEYSNPEELLNAFTAFDE